MRHNLRVVLNQAVVEPLKGHEANPQNRFESSCCATQHETKWQAPERRAKKYGPATIREAHIHEAVSEVLGQPHFNAAAFRGQETWSSNY